MSAIGSVIVSSLSRLLVLPAALGHARDVARQGQLAETQTAQRELAHIRARTSASTAPVAVPHFELQGLALARLLCTRGHRLVPCPERHAEKLQQLPRLFVPLRRGH